jgi:hypothetical protein
MKGEFLGRCSFKKYEIKMLKLYRIVLCSDLYKSMIYFIITPEIFPKIINIKKDELGLYIAFFRQL